MTAVALISSALAVGAASAANHSAYSAGRTAGPTAGLANTNIQGKPAHFSPTRVSGKARWNGVSTCTGSNASFTIDNKEGSTQSVTFTGAAHGLVTIPAHAKYYICVLKGSTGKSVGTLSDGKRLHVHTS